MTGVLFAASTRGLPRGLVRLFSPLFRSRGVHACFRCLVHPVAAWLAMNVAYLLWHVPALFELTFRSERWHDFEHLCFVGTSLLFWWVVVQPWPARAWWPRWTVIPFLLSDDVVNTVLSAALTFSGRVFYPSYAAARASRGSRRCRTRLPRVARCGCSTPPSSSTPPLQAQCGSCHQVIFPQGRRYNGPETHELAIRGTHVSSPRVSGASLRSRLISHRR